MSSHSLPDDLHELLDVYQEREQSTSYKANLRWLARKLEAFYPCSTSPDFYCYIYLDPRYPGNYRYVLPSGKVVRFEYRPFYVGKGKGDRWETHLYESRWSCSATRKSHKASKLRKINEAGLEPVVVVTPTRVSESLALAFETDLILGIGRTCDGGSLTNIASGGLGSCVSNRRNGTWAPMAGKKHSAETRARMRAAHLGKKCPWNAERAGWKHTAESRAKISEGHKGIGLGKKQSPEHVARRFAAIKANREAREKEKMVP